MLLLGHVLLLLGGVYLLMGQVRAPPTTQLQTQNPALRSLGMG